MTSNAIQLKTYSNNIFWFGNTLVHI